MFSRALASGIGASLALAAAAHADHKYSFFCFATVTSLEGTPPSNMRIGEQIRAQYIFDTGIEDADSSPGLGLYPDAVRAGRGGFILFPSGTSMRLFRSGDVTVIDNSALGDVYRAGTTSVNNAWNVNFELTDAESAAFDSDVQPISFDMANYHGQFDVARLTIEVTSPTTYRAIAAITSIEVRQYFCECDWNRDDEVTSQDFFDYITGFFTNEGDYNHDGATNTQDLFDFLTCFFNPANSCS